MIEYLHGQLTEVTPALAIIECGGVGYGVNISLNTYSAIQQQKEVKLWITEMIREDSHQLWGFASRIERSLFLLLTSVSGIGAGIARLVLNAMTPADLCNIISEGNDKMLKQVKGIGPKAAQRIIVDLKDKIGSLGIEASQQQTASGKPMDVNREVLDEAVSALTMLGFAPAASHKVAVQLLREHPEAPVEQVIKWALKIL
ncbi:MAG: Holliday junction branch migration protein RuvA [Bacteroidaceae bacterium]